MLQYLLSLLPKSEKGQDMAEYGLLLALIALVVVAALIILGPQIADIFTQIGNALTGAGG